MINLCVFIPHFGCKNATFFALIVGFDCKTRDRDTLLKGACMHKRKGILPAAALVLALLLGTAAPVWAAERAEDEPVTLSCAEVPLYADGVYIGSGFLTDSVTLVPLRTFTETMLGTACQVDWDPETETATLTAEDLVISLAIEDGYLIANGRYIYLHGMAYNINGTLMVPVRELARVFGVEVGWDGDDWSVRIDTQALSLLESGDSFYPEEDLYWLSHVIYSESGNQPLEGMIGVGNVVLNRARDDSGLFDAGIQGVIFQPGQFDVVPAGTIYMDPSDKAVAAAKLCLEGYNTVGDAKWFVNPTIGAAGWFERNTTFAVTIQDHDFYA